MADIESVGDFLEMLLMGPGRYFGGRERERERERLETEQADIQKEADIEQQDFMDAILAMLIPETLGTTFTDPVTGRSMSALPGVQVPKGAAGVTDIYPEDRTPTAGLLDLTGRAGAGDIDIEGLMALLPLLESVGGGLYEAPEAAAEDTFNPDQFDLISTLTRGPEGRGG
jgi:hypothetical protein